MAASAVESALAAGYRHVEATADRQFVVEAIRGDETAKVELFAALDAIMEDPDAILATNTSSPRLTPGSPGRGPSVQQAGGGAASFYGRAPRL
ncbi:hypothetical protein GCM10023086_33540 [Streptomyces venetus]|uniref:3-hydroxyacyl-CoA dehydrogenase NAD binding domain-containing protein n=1 Tax=Streptomyces venetus TaxID=1701086 RepID=A0ABP8FX79_9ACTN